MIGLDIGVTIEKCTRLSPAGSHNSSDMGQSVHSPGHLLHWPKNLSFSPSIVTRTRILQTRIAQTGMTRHMAGRKANSPPTRSLSIYGRIKGLTWLTYDRSFLLWSSGHHHTEEHKEMCFPVRAPKANTTPLLPRTLRLRLQEPSRSAPRTSSDRYLESRLRKNIPHTNRTRPILHNFDNAVTSALGANRVHIEGYNVLSVFDSASHLVAQASASKPSPTPA